MVAKTQTKPEGPASLRAALRDLSQAVRLLCTWARAVHPGSLSDELEAACERKLRPIERLAMSD